MKFTRTVPYLLSLLVLGGILILADPGEVLELLHTLSWPRMTVAAGWYGLTLLLRACRFHGLFSVFHGTQLRPGAVGYLTSLGALANQVLPFRAGEVLFVTIGRSRFQIPADTGLLVLGMARLFDLVGLLTVFLTASVLRTGLEGGRGLALLTGTGLGLMLIIFRMDLLLSGISRFLMRWTSGRWQEARQRLASRLQLLTGRAAELRSSGRILLYMATSLLIWIALMLCFQEVLAALGEELPLQDVAVGSAGAAVAGFLPVNVAGNLGILEAGWTLGFVAIGMEQPLAVTSGLAMHSLVIATGGVLVLLSGLGLLLPSRRQES